MLSKLMILIMLFRKPEWWLPIKELDENSKKPQNIQYSMQPRYINVNFDRCNKIDCLLKSTFVCRVLMSSLNATSNRVSPRFEITNRSLTTIEDRWWPRWHRRPHTPRCGQTSPSLWSDPQCGLGWTLGLISYHNCHATRHHWRVQPLHKTMLITLLTFCYQ